MDDSLHVLVISDRGSWTAVGLEHAVVAWGESPLEAIDRFSSTLWLELAACSKRGEMGLESIPKAPQMYWDMKKDAVPLAGPIKIDPPRLPQPPDYIVPQNMIPKISAAVR